MEALMSLKECIDVYYYWSFRLTPEKCSGHFIAVLDGLEGIGKYLDKKENITIEGIVQKMLVCLEQNDCVILRDILHYELRPLIGRLLQKKCN